MTKYEIKKVFSKISNKIAVLVLFIIMGITCFFALDVSYVDEAGNTQNGPSAIARLKTAQKEWAGYLDEEKIREVITENRRIRNTPEALSQNVRESEIAYSWMQGIIGIRDLLNCSYATGFRDYDYYLADSLTEDAAPDFYQNRVRLLEEWLEDEAKDQFSDKEKEYLISQYNNLATPFYYDYMAGWQQLFEFAPTIVMLTMLILGYLVAGIFQTNLHGRLMLSFFQVFMGEIRR